MKSLVSVSGFARAVLSASLVLVAATVSAQSSVAPAGEGTAESPYQIAELGHLVWMGEHVSESAGKHYLMLNDIDASPCEGYWDYGYNNQYATGIWQGGFDPVGGDEGFFCGVFDGGGHIVRGIRVGDRSLAGLFGSVGESGLVCNLGVSGAYLNGSVAGGIAAKVDGGAISNCWVSAILHGCSTAGGIAGEVYRGTVFRCYATGACQPLTGYGGRVGGAVSECSSEATVSECYAAVALKGETKGGLVACGSDLFLMTNSYWDVEVSQSGTSWMGGEGKMSAEMRQAETFVGWDFTDVWGIDEGASAPYLRMFPPPFTLSVVTQGVGHIEVVPQKEAYQPGERVTLTAYSDAPGYVFKGWIGGESNALSTVTTVTMSGHRTLLAAFVPATEISTVEELQAMSGANNYRLSQDIDASATTDWNGGTGFAPVGGSFTGIFDGNGHVIRGLTINRPGQDGVGLFQEVAYPGLVRRMGLEEGSVVGGNAVGALAGFIWGGVFEECSSACDVTGVGYVGGLLGRTHLLSEQFIVIVRCHATGNVSARSADSSETWCAGGLVGYLSAAIVEESFAAGNVTCQNNVGGLLGVSSSWFRFNRINRCYASGSVSGDIGVGGLIGNDEGRRTIVRGCLASGNTTGRREVSGLIGMGGDDDFLQADGSRVTQIGESYAVGRITRADPAGDALVGLPGSYLYWSPTAYWDVETTWISTGPFNFGKTTAQMKQMATYANWDFTNVWGVAEGVSYPYLRSLGTRFRLHVVAEGPGRVIVSPLKASYAPGEVVTLTAIPDAATNMLGRWVGLVADTEAPVTPVTMDIHKTVTAVFVTPKVIASIEDLQAIENDSAYQVYGSYRLSQDIDASHTTNWNDGAGFAPIASEWSAFSGILDGQGHTIRGLMINRPAQTGVGLIGVQGPCGSIRNIRLADCSVTGGGSVGGCVGGNVRGSVSHVFVSGFVSGAGEVGGVIGKNFGTVTKCYTSGAIASTNTAGGLVGGQYMAGRVYESYAAASVSGGTAAGGLVGLVDVDAYGVVTQSYWDTEASGCAVSEGGEGKTTAEMMRQATYAGWNFSTEWGIEEGAGYPFLWQFRLALPPGLGMGYGTNRPAYAAWAASHTNAWGTADFSGMPARDFETAWLLDQRPEAGFAEASGLSVAGFEVGEDDIRVILALTASGAAKQGCVNGWVAVQGRGDLSEDWVVVAAQQAGADRVAFADGVATVTFARPEGYAFFRPVLLPSGADAAIPLLQVAP